VPICRISNSAWALARAASQRIIVARVELIHIRAVEALVADLHPRAERPDCGKLLGCETDGLGGRGKATVAEPLPRTSLTLRRRSSDFNDNETLGVKGNLDAPWPLVMHCADRVSTWR